MLNPFAITQDYSLIQHLLVIPAKAGIQMIFLMKITTLFLTCADEREADEISDILLRKKLVVCIKNSKVKSSFLYKGKVNEANEVLLVMDSAEEKFSAIEKEVRKIHSYETFVLLATPVIRSSKGVKEWMKSELK